MSGVPILLKIRAVRGGQAQRARWVSSQLFAAAGASIWHRNVEVKLVLLRCKKCGELALLRDTGRRKRRLRWSAPIRNIHSVAYAMRGKAHGGVTAQGSQRGNENRMRCALKLPPFKLPHGQATVSVRFRKPRNSRPASGFRAASTRITTAPRHRRTYQTIYHRAGVWGADVPILHGEAERSCLW